MPYTVSMYFGKRGSFSILRRMFLTCASMARSKDSPSLPRTASSSCALGGGEIDRVRTTHDLEPRHIQREIAELYAIRGRVGTAGPPQDGLHPRDELTWTERLGDVVVRAELETQQPIGFLDARRQHDDRHVRARAQRPRHRETVDFRQAEVEHD